MEDNHQQEEDLLYREEPYLEEEPLTEQEYFGGEPPEDMLPE